MDEGFLRESGQGRYEGREGAKPLETLLKNTDEAVKSVGRAKLKRVRGSLKLKGRKGVQEEKKFTKSERVWKERDVKPRQMLLVQAPHRRGEAR